MKRKNRKLIFILMCNEAMEGSIGVRYFLCEISFHTTLIFPAWFPFSNENVSTVITQFYIFFSLPILIRNCSALAGAGLAWLANNKSIEILGFESFSSVRWLLHWRMVNIKPTMPLCSSKEKSSKIFVSLIYVQEHILKVNICFQTVKLNLF